MNIWLQYQIIDVDFPSSDSKGVLVTKLLKGEVVVYYAADYGDCIYSESAVDRLLSNVSV